MSIPKWFVPWLRWKIRGGARPAKAPKRIPDWAFKAHAWFVRWGRWYVAGKPGKRPTNPKAPSRLPAWAWDVLADPKVVAALKALGPPPPPSPPRLPDLGPLIADGQSVLDYDLTHTTGGVGYPAFDFGWKAGKPVIAPEPLEITDEDGAVRRDGRPNGRAFDATGASGIPYWLGHLEGVPRVGAKVAKGEKVGVISSNHEEPHGHCGIDLRKLLGGKVAEHHTNYTHGAPTIREQLERALT